MLVSRAPFYRSGVKAFATTCLSVACLAMPATAQQAMARRDTVPLRADYRDLSELLSHLPAVAPRPFDESLALWLGALPLSCLDRLQPRPGGRGGGRANAPAPADSARVRGGNAADSTNSPPSMARGSAAAATAGNGAAYFWVASYTLMNDHDRLRAFWGCNDWHSAVSSTWTALRVLQSYPNSTLRDLTREKLNAHLGRANLDGELSFFRATAEAINPIPSASQTGLFERPYGFAWLLELASALRTWPDTQGKRWSGNIAPLATWMADSLGAYFTKLVEPIRTGAQGNTALNMTLALDYADVVHDARLRSAIVSTARKFYLPDSTCSTQSEGVVPAGGGRGGRGGGGGGRASSADSSRLPAPNDLTAASRGAPPPIPFGGGGVVVVSPCLSEAALMSRVLDQQAYVAWIDRVLPPLQSGRFAPLTEAIAIPTAAPPPTPQPPAVAAPIDTTPAGRAATAAAAAAALATERARITGLSFSRAQSMERIARALPATDPRVAAWHRLSAIQADRGFELMRDDQAGLSWVPAQAILYLTLSSEGSATDDGRRPVRQ